MSVFIQKYNAPFLESETELPFEVKFNFGQLISFWKEQLQSSDAFRVAQAKSILGRLKNPDALTKSFRSIRVLEKHESDLRLLLDPLFAPQLTLNEIRACIMPFVPIFIRPTERLRNIVDNAGGTEHVIFRVPNEMAYFHASLFLLNFYYQANIDFQKSLYFDIPDAQRGIQRHYRAFFNGDFSSFRPKKGTRLLKPADIQALIDRFGDLEFWKSKIPPNSMVFEGFGLMTLFDVTLEEAVSSLKLNLLKKDALTSPYIVDKIQQSLCSLLNQSDLKVGFVSYDQESRTFKSLGYGFWNSILLSDKSEKHATDLYGDGHCPTGMNLKEAIFIHEKDITADGCAFGSKLIEKGYKSYVCIPLLFENRTIGALELASPQDGAFSHVTVSQLESVIALFVTAMKRSLDEHETKLEAIIQEKCTAIHPSVSWRFFEAAENLLNLQQYMDTKEMEEISFQDVYPLYGQSDIKSSSNLRNEAIRSDLTTQLHLAKKILEQAFEQGQLPIYGELIHRIENSIHGIAEGLGAGDELNILDFLRSEIYPVFNHLEATDPSIGASIKEYNATVNDDLGIIYDRRKDYEESVALVNDTMANYLERAQQKAQAMFPHYFEKYKTDGIEHNLYIGRSLVKNQPFHPIYLRNLRLWQLMVICEIENEVYRLKPRMKMPLDICSLVLVHSNPLAIRFRTDEKRFDVDGTYNIRYEIIKKRIDKALIRGTNERLTQPKQLAIVYSQDKEAKEYVHYLEYLVSIDYLEEGIEWLELNDLQGIQRLKALRATIRVDSESRTAPQSEQVLRVASSN